MHKGSPKKAGCCQSHTSKAAVTVLWRHTQSSSDKSGQWRQLQKGWRWPTNDGHRFHHPCSFCAVQEFLWDCLVHIMFSGDECFLLNPILSVPGRPKSEMYCLWSGEESLLPTEDFVVGGPSRITVLSNVLILNLAFPATLQKALCSLILKKLYIYIYTNKIILLSKSVTPCWYSIFVSVISNVLTPDD